MSAVLPMKAIAKPKTMQTRQSRLLVLSEQYRITHHQHVHFGAEKAIKRLFWLTNHGLILIERGVEYHRDAGEVAISPNQPVIARISATIDGLQPSGAVDVGDRRDQSPLLLADLEYLHHEGNG